MTCSWPRCERPGTVQVGYVAPSDLIPRLAGLCTWHKHELRIMITAARTAEVEELFEAFSRTTVAPPSR